MTIHLVTFSDEGMSRAAELCTQSAERVGGVNDSLRWHHEDLLKTDFYRNNVDILSQPRGLGYWAWKPWVVLNAMEGKMTGEQFIQNSFTPPKDGDILIYSDAGVEFINNVSHIIERMDQDIFLFGNNWEQAHWCKGDIPATILRKQTANGAQNWLWQDHPQHDAECDCRKATIIFGKQCQASVIFFRVSDYSRQFVAEWLKWCLFEGGRLIDDSPSRFPNHPEFRENRHDQAILTTLAYREGIKLHAWPAVYNRFLGREFVYSREGYPESDNYPALFHHHRFRNKDFESL